MALTMERKAAAMGARRELADGGRVCEEAGEEGGRKDHGHILGIHLCGLDARGIRGKGVEEAGEELDDVLVGLGQRVDKGAGGGRIGGSEGGVVVGGGDERDKELAEPELEGASNRGDVRGRLGEDLWQLAKVCGLLEAQDVEGIARDAEDALGGGGA